MFSQEISKVKKVCIIEDERTQVTNVFNEEFHVYGDQLNLDSLLIRLDNQARQSLRIYDFSQKRYLELDTQTTFIPLMTQINPHTQVILFKYGGKKKTLLQPSFEERNSERFEYQSEGSSQKRERSKERIIFQVIEIIKKWRQIHVGRESFKKVSLQQAAKRVGLPKKSLDDYYYQLRLGQQYGFDFKSHLNDRFGVLRSFLRGIKEGGSLKPSDKHPKKLKIIDDFMQLQEYYRASTGHMSDEQNRSEMHQQERQIKIQEQLSEADNKRIYNEFYNEFQFLLDQKDPFLNFDYNFKKKEREQNVDELC